MAPTAMRHKAIDKSTFIPKPYVIAGRFAVRVRTSGLSARQRSRMLVIAERGFLPGVVFYRAATLWSTLVPGLGASEKGSWWPRAVFIFYRRHQMFLSTQARIPQTILRATSIIVAHLTLG
ncbi:hypothetical protein R3P38DRAFT_3379661 [Favolaschia claudopus]|uniref:Uncharacterized protein n=1 Tax=Favolaschia claudopus TaxID=2862362 RepID=A0AAV9Z4T7_9AGAR